MKRPLLVLGATGAIGRCVVETALEAARPVVAVARDAQELRALKAAHARADLETCALAIRDEQDGIDLATSLRKLGRPLAGVVVALCGTSTRGRLLDQTPAALRDRLGAVLLPQLVAARHLLPVLVEGNRGAGYVVVGSPGGETPWAGYGPHSVAAAALRMFVRVLHDEAHALGIRAQFLAVDTPVCTDHNRRHACPRWPTALDIGRHAFELVARGEGALPAQPIVSLPAQPSIQSVASAAGARAAQDPERAFRTDARRLLDDALGWSDSNSPTSLKRNEDSR